MTYPQAFSVDSDSSFFFNSPQRRIQRGLRRLQAPKIDEIFFRKPLLQQLLQKYVCSNYITMQKLCSSSENINSLSNSLLKTFVLLNCIFWRRVEKHGKVGKTGRFILYVIYIIQCTI